MALLTVPRVVVRIWNTAKQCYAHVCTQYAHIQTAGFKTLCQQKWNHIQEQTGVDNLGGLLQLIAREVRQSAQISMFEFSVQYGFGWLGEKFAPHVFADSVLGNLDERYFSDLMGRHTHLDSAEIILAALQYAPNDLRAQLFAKSVRVHSSFYTEKLIPPVVSKDGIVALIQHNNIPMLGKILNASDLSFMVATSAMLGHHKLLETFEHRVDLSEVIQFIDTEKWYKYQIYPNKDEQKNLIAEYQNKLLRRVIHNEISNAPEIHCNVKRRKI